MLVATGCNAIDVEQNAQTDLPITNQPELQESPSREDSAPLAEKKEEPMDEESKPEEPAMNESPSDDEEKVEIVYLDSWPVDMTFDSMETFVQALQNPVDYLKADTSDVDQGAFLRLNNFFVPSAVFEGYQLEFIHFSEYCIHYRYTCGEESVEVQYRYNLQLQEGEDAITAVVHPSAEEQMEDGTVFQKHFNFTRTYLSVGQQLLSFELPISFGESYEAVKPYLTYEKKTVEKDPSWMYLQVVNPIKKDPVLLGEEDRQKVEQQFASLTWQKVAICPRPALRLFFQGQTYHYLMGGGLYTEDGRYASLSLEEYPPFEAMLKPYIGEDEESFSIREILRMTAWKNNGEIPQPVEIPPAVAKDIVKLLNAGDWKTDSVDYATDVCIGYGDYCFFYDTKTGMVWIGGVRGYSAQLEDQVFEQINRFLDAYLD